MEDLLYVK